MKAFPELAIALAGMLDQMDESFRAAGYRGDSILMYLAGGLAVNYWCGTRYTEDVDASFSRRLILPKNLTVNYRRKDGTDAFLYFDHNYNTSFALLHERFEDDSVEWKGLGNERRIVRLRVLSPVDLAVSKIARFSAQDEEDILALGRESLFTADELRRRATEALADYVGDLAAVRVSLDLICWKIADDRPDESKKW
jgi:hypothetical protein